MSKELEVRWERVLPSTARHVCAITVQTAAPA